MELKTFKKTVNGLGTTICSAEDISVAVGSSTVSGKNDVLTRIANGGGQADCSRTASAANKNESPPSGEDPPRLPLEQQPVSE